MFEDARKALTCQISDRGFFDRAAQAFISSDPFMRVEPRVCRSNFFCALTLLALQAAARPEDGLDFIRDDVARALQSEWGPHGTVNYWMRDEPLRSTRPYPNDLDTTACTLAALSIADPSHRADLLGGAVRALTAVETQEGGPYRTWLVTPDAPAAWRDVDVAVNANIAFFLSLHEIRLEPLDAWLAERILHADYASPYYPSPFPIWYFLARGYEGPARQKLQDDILARQEPNGGWGNLLDDALAVSALSRLDPNPRVLLDAQRRLAARVLAGDDGANAFCIDSIHDGHRFYAGSPMLTTAICLEALMSETDSLKPFATDALGEEEGMLGEIRQRIRVHARQMGEPLTSRLEALAEKMIVGMPGCEIPMLPALFNACLASGQASQEIICDLGLANLFGWIAYTIYDDVLDEEGNTRDLPLANACMRRVDEIFLRFAVESPSIGALYQEVMDALERANAWEVQNARFTVRDGIVLLPAVLPSYGNLEMLADRSFGHALGPLCILLLAGYDLASESVQSLTIFFRHALIARQLDDDAHDWAEDLTAGRLNAVAERILRAWRANGHEEKAVDIHALAGLRHFFWEECMDDIATTILHHVDVAERALARLQIVKTIEPLCALLASVKQSAEKARRGVRETKVFIASYRREVVRSDI